MINRDGSAEFQNVLVRGTITGSTIIGSTIIGGTIIGGDIQSSNFSNVAHTGFDLNATATTDSAGTPANTIQVYSNFQVGPTGGNNLTLLYSGTASAIAFNTGNPADLGSAGLGTDTFVQGGSGRTISEISMVSARENGSVLLELFPSGGTTAADFPATAIFGTSPTTTSPTGWDGVKGRMFLGQLAADVWQLQIINENSVIDPGPSIGRPPLVLGDVITPASRLYVSVSEILSVTGSNLTETLYLNTNNTQAIAGGVVNPTMRQQSTVIAGAVTPGAAYASVGGIAGIPCPSSGTGTVWMRMTVTGSAATTSSAFIAGCPNIVNTTSGLTVFAATDNRAAEVDGNFLTAANGGIITVMTQICATGLGNPLDQLTITAQAHQNVAGAFSIKKIEIGWIPSL